jgi:hypothetical protein
VTVALAWTPCAVVEQHGAAVQDAIQVWPGAQVSIVALAWTPDEPEVSASIQDAPEERASIQDEPGWLALPRDEPVGEPPDEIQDVIRYAIQDDPAACRVSPVLRLLQDDSPAGHVPDRKHVQDQKVAVQRQPFLDGHGLH